MIHLSKKWICAESSDDCEMIQTSWHHSPFGKHVNETRLDIEIFCNGRFTFDGIGIYFELEEDKTLYVLTWI